MAHYKPQSRRVLKESKAKPGLRLAGVSALFLSIGYALWLAVCYSNSTTSSWASAQSFSDRAAQDVDARSPRRPLLASSILAFAEPAPGNMAPPGRIHESQFSRAFLRLDTALRVHKNVDPDQILASVNARSKRDGAESRPCPIAWNDGEPSLMLAEQMGVGLSLPATLDRCSAAIESMQ